MSKRIQRKLCRNFTTSKNCQRELSLYKSILLTAISGETHRFLHPQADKTANTVHSNGKVISKYSRNLKVISHDFIRPKLKIYTDHKNPKCKNFNTDRVLSRYL